MPYSTRAMRDEDWPALSPEFLPTEFRKPDTMGFEFMHWLHQLRKRAGVPMKVTSSSRTPARNAAAGGAADSAHLDLPICDAVDIKPRNNAERFLIVFAAYELGCRRFGIYANGSIHLDRTEGRRPAPRLWTKSR